MKHKLTIKQKKFADEYIISGNATESYKQAGYKWTSDKVAGANGQKVLNNPKVQAYLAERLKEIDDQAIATQEEVLKYLTSVLRGETLSEVVVVEGEGDGYSSAKRVEKSPDEKERLKAAELLGRRYGLYIDKTNLEADLELKVVVDYGED